MSRAAIVVCGLTSLFAATAAGQNGATPAATTPAATTQTPSTQTFSLYLLGHRIGEERRTATALAGARTLSFDFKYVDRGTEVALASTLEFGADGTPRHFTTKGRTYRYFSTDCDVLVTGTTAHVRDAGRTYDLDIAGKLFFPLDNVAPIGVHEELIKYWLAHGRPAELLTAPAGPVHITSRGVDLMDVGEGDYRFSLERLAIDGAVWGRETAFVTRGGPRKTGEATGETPPPAGEMLGLFSWVGGLGFEAIADTNEAHFDELAKLALADRMDDLRAWTTSIRPRAAGTFALTGATIIDGVGHAPIVNGTILVRAGRITAVGSAAAVSIPPGTPVVDAKGQFVIPGLWDMHAHVTQIDWFPSYLASGVTTIRDMGGEFPFLKAAKDAIAGGALGPRLLNAGLIDGPGARAFGSTTASTPEEARALVRKYHDAGFEQIKVYLIVPRDLVSVIADEAHKLGMTVTGHLPSGMTQADVLAAGFDSIAHMALRGPAGSPAAAASIALFKEHGTVMDPTLSWSEFLGHPSALPLSALHPDINRLPPTLARLLAGTTLPTADPVAWHARQVETWKLLPAALAAGLPIVAGTGKGIPGFSLQRELEIYVEGGMTPLEALQTATIIPARVMKLDSDTGSIEAGKRADFVVIGANPLEHISAIRQSRMVAIGGRLYAVGPLWEAAGFSR